MYTFTLLNRQKKRAVKINGVYNLVESYVQENNPLLISFNLSNPQNQIVTDKRQAYLLKYVTPPMTALFGEQGFEFKDRHLTIDKYFAKSTSRLGHGFTAAHYTENYVHPETKEARTVHVYFSEQDSYVQIKNDSAVLSLAFENMIFNNAYQALQLFKELQELKSNTWTEQLNKVNSTEAELDQLSKDLKSEAKKLQFKKIAQSFIREVELLNCYNDSEIDCRDELIQQRLHLLEEEQLQEARESQQNNVVAEPSSSFSSMDIVVAAPSSAEKKKSHDFVSYKALAFAQLKQLGNLLDMAIREKNSAQTIQLSSQIKMTLIEFYFFKKLTKEEAKLISELERKTEKLKSPEKFAITQFNEGNFKAFITVFPSLTHAEQHCVISEIFLKLLDFHPVTGSVEAAQIKICDFLHENSSIYAARIAMDDDFLYVPAKANISVTSLVMVCVLKKKNILSMLLRHGMNPNTIGALKAKKTYTVIQAVVGLCSDPFYVQTLLAHGSTIDTPQTTLNNRQIKLLSEHMIKTTKVKFSDFDSIPLFKNDEGLKTNLLIAYFSNHDKVAELLIERTSLANLALSYARLSDCMQINCRFILGRSKIQTIYGNREEANQALSQSKAVKNTIQLNFFAMQDSCQKTRDHLEYLKKLICVFDQRCHKPSNEILEVLEALWKMDDKTNTLTTRMINYACRLIVVQQFNLDKIFAQRFALYSYHIAEALLGEGKIRAAIEYLEEARRVCKEFEIMDTPIYNTVKERCDLFVPTKELEVTKAAIVLHTRLIYLNPPSIVSFYPKENDVGGLKQLVPQSAPLASTETASGLRIFKKQ
jgi:hypothetical protein